MTEKRFRILLKEFVRYTGGVTFLIGDGNVQFHVGEVKEDTELICQWLNNLNDQIIAQGVVIEGYQDRNQKLFEKNKQLKSENELLKKELEQCKAVIDKQWMEYVDKEMSE